MTKVDVCVFEAFLYSFLVDISISEKWARVFGDTGISVCVACCWCRKPSFMSKSTTQTAITQKFMKVLILSSAKQCFLQPISPRYRFLRDKGSGTEFCPCISSPTHCPSSFLQDTGIPEKFNLPKRIPVSPENASFIACVQANNHQSREENKTRLLCPIIVI